MPLTASIVEALAARCAPAVAPSTLVALAGAESRFEPLAIGVNGPAPYRIVPPTREQAIAYADRLIAAGGDIDLGLVQINSRTMKRVGLSIAGAFDVCRSLRAGSEILREGYRRAGPGRIGPQAALRVAFSYYNTGRPDRGFKNGYVARVTSWTPRSEPTQVPASQETSPAPWNVFARAQPPSLFVSHPTAEGDLP